MGKRKVRRPGERFQRLLGQSPGKMLWWSESGVLTGEEKEVILRDAGGGKTQIWRLGKRKTHIQRVLHL